MHVNKHIDGLDRTCDHKCVFCLERIEPDCGAVVVPSCEKIRDALATLAKSNCNVNKIYIAGGEPTLRNDIYDIVRLAKMHFPEVCLNTHGDFSDSATRVSALVEAGLTEVCLSLHGDVASIHEWHTRTKGSYSRTLTTMMDFLESGIPVRVNYVVTSQNIDRLGRMVAKISRMRRRPCVLCFMHYLNHGAAFYEPILGFNVDRHGKDVSEAIATAQDSRVVVHFRDFPFCVDNRIRSLNETVDLVSVLVWRDADLVALVPERPPVVWKSKCIECDDRPLCPGYLKANYGEDKFVDV